MQKKQIKSSLKLRGFFRVQLVEQDGQISGDSGWQPNMVVNLGKFQYLITPLGGGAAKAVGRMGLGTSTTPGAATDTALAGELTHNSGASATRNRATVVVASTQASLGSTAVEFQGVFASTNSFVTTTAQIAGIMVIDNTTSGGTIFAQNTFSASVVNTNQDVQASYKITFGP